jgi:hypothetical protein
MEKVDYIQFRNVRLTEKYYARLEAQTRNGWKVVVERQWLIQNCALTPIY